MTLLLLLAIMAPLSFAFVSYHWQLKMIKREVKEQLIQETPQSAFVEFSFRLGDSNFKSLRWEHEHEFEYDHKMFDIVEADTLGQLVHYLCFPDKQETALNALFKQKLKERYSQDRPAQNKANQILSFIYGLYFVNDSLEKVFNPLSKQQQFAAYLKLDTQVCLDELSPPPQTS